MRPARTKKAAALTDTGRVLAALSREGVYLDRGKTVSVSTLYTAVCRLMRVKSRRDGNVPAQWAFLRRWLAEREASIACSREPAPFREYVVPRAMRDALARCEELRGRVSKL